MEERCWCWHSRSDLSLRWRLLKTKGALLAAVAAATVADAHAAVVVVVVVVAAAAAEDGHT